MQHILENSHFVRSRPGSEAGPRWAVDGKITQDSLHNEPAVSH